MNCFLETKLENGVSVVKFLEFFFSPHLRKISQPTEIGFLTNLQSLLLDFNYFNHRIHSRYVWKPFQSSDPESGKFSAGGHSCIHIFQRHVYRKLDCEKFPSGGHFCIHNFQPRAFQKAMLTKILVGINDGVVGVWTFFGVDFFAPSVVLTTGTFMNGKIWVGRSSMSAGRAGETTSQGPTENMQGFGFETDRLKTGTPAGVDSQPSHC